MAAAQRPIELIQARSLISTLTTAAFLVDEAGTLLYYNRGAPGNCSASASGTPARCRPGLGQPLSAARAGRPGAGRGRAAADDRASGWRAGPCPHGDHGSRRRGPPDRGQRDPDPRAGRPARRIRDFLAGLGSAPALRLPEGHLAAVGSGDDAAPALGAPAGRAAPHRRAPAPGRSSPRRPGPRRRAARAARPERTRRCRPRLGLPSPGRGRSLCPAWMRSGRQPKSLCRSRPRPADRRCAARGAPRNWSGLAHRLPIRPTVRPRFIGRDASQPDADVYSPWNR